MPRRKPGTLLPLETGILDVEGSMLRPGHATPHRVGLARTRRAQQRVGLVDGPRNPRRGLDPLEELGLLTSGWEDPAVAEGRPRWRRELALQGAEVAAQALADPATRCAPRAAAALT